MQETELPVLMTVKEAAEYLLVTPQTVRNLAKDNLIDSISIGGEYRIVCDTLLESLKKPTSLRKNLEKIKFRFAKTSQNTLKHTKTHFTDVLTGCLCANFLYHFPHLAGADSFCNGAIKRLNLIARGRAKQASGAMSLYKTFKTVEDSIEYLKDNIETLDDGEVTFKDWFELGNLVEKYKKDYGLATKDKQSLRKKQEEADKKVAELTEQLELANDELTSLKESQGGNDKEALQKAIKEKSEAIVQRNALETKVKELEKNQSRIPELEKQVADFQTAQNRSIILEAVKKAMAKCKVPQSIIDDPDITRNVVAFAIDETGNILTTGENQQTVENHIIAKQKEKPHWSAVTVTAGGEDMVDLLDYFALCFVVHFSLAISDMPDYFTPIGENPQPPYCGFSPMCYTLPCQVCGGFPDNKKSALHRRELDSKRTKARRIFCVNEGREKHDIAEGTMDNPFLHTDIEIIDMGKPPVEFLEKISEQHRQTAKVAWCGVVIAAFSMLIALVALFRWW